MGGFTALGQRPPLAMAATSAGRSPEAPWFRRDQISTTYNYCDMCPWKCGIVDLVDGVVR